MLTRFKEKYASRKLSKLVAAQSRNPVIPDPGKHIKVGVIWQPTQKFAFQYLYDHFRREQVIFRDYCIFDSASNPAAEANSLTVNDLDWWGIPKPEKVGDFMEMNFDLLLSIAMEQNFAVEYVTALTRAKFKIGGSAGDDSHFDLNINIGENQDALYLAKQQIFYLAQLNKNTAK